MAVLILAKHDNAHLIDATAKTVTAAKAMGGDITVLVAGENAGAVAEAASKLDGVRRVIHVEGAAYGHRLAEPRALPYSVRTRSGPFQRVTRPSSIVRTLNAITCWLRSRSRARTLRLPPPG